MKSAIMMCVLAATLATIPLWAAEGVQARFDTAITRIVAAYNQRDYEGLRRDFARPMLDALSVEEARSLLSDMSNQFGKVTKADPSRSLSPGTVVAVLHFERGLLDVKLTLDEQGRVTGLVFGPHPPDIPAPARNQTELRLPFRGEWFVMWGGDTRELNQHHDVPNQRFAFDFLGADAQGRTHQGDGTRNEDYYAFGREILAPADGVVTDVIDGVRDNAPGSMNPYAALGNAVFIKHRDYEVSVMAHFRLGSIRVKAGDRVFRGQVLGQCGNSGNSSEPHLHYHLENTPVIQDATGIKCFFRDVIVARDGKTDRKADYSPLKGDVVSARR
jgi:murein DD-endopeptidase MepM/ murein hydrolase activator NlpD